MKHHRNINFCLRLSNEEKAILDLLARTWGLTKSSTLRRLLLTEAKHSDIKTPMTMNCDTLNSPSNNSESGDEIFTPIQMKLFNETD